MHALKTAFYLLCLGSNAAAKLHHLYVGSFNASAIHNVAFDDETLTLSLVRSFSTSDPHFWIDFDHEKENIYATSVSKWTSYKIMDDMSIVPVRSLPLTGSCPGSQSIFLTTSSHPPHRVYGASFGGAASCGNILSVDENNTLSEIIQAFDYGPGSGVHGLALSPRGEMLYSADDTGNAVWAHRVDSRTGEVHFVDRLAAPAPGADPRHIAVHPGGGFAYVVFEGTNKLAVYSIDSDGGLTYADISYPLIPQDHNTTAYLSDEVSFSHSTSYLWASSRSRIPDSPGYITAFTLSPSGEIQSQLFLTPTSSSGGMANAVSPSAYSDEFVALTDNERGFVQVWGFDGVGAGVVDTLELAGNGCCANAIWYD